VIIFRT